MLAPRWILELQRAHSLTNKGLVAEAGFVLAGNRDARNSEWAEGEELHRAWKAGEREPYRPAITYMEKAHIPGRGKRRYMECKYLRVGRTEPWASPKPCKYLLGGKGA